MTTNKEHRRYLEQKRARLVRDLRRVNEELRERQPVDASKGWDFDPRAVEMEVG